MSKTAPLNPNMAYCRLPAEPPINGRFCSRSVYVNAWPVPKSPPRENFCNLLILLSFWRKIFYGWMFLSTKSDKFVEANSTNRENLNNFKRLQLDVFVERFGKNCPTIGQNCPMTEQYSKTGRRSQSRMYRAQSLASISLFHRLMERTN